MLTTRFARLGLDLNQEGETLTDSSESRPWGKDTWFECFSKPMLIPYGWSILTKQSDPDWSPYDFT
ncbi:hypothetical protein HKD37_09G026714 [Glycine soja]